jgi:hypothetical protein
MLSFYPIVIISSTISLVPLINEPYDIPNSYVSPTLQQPIETMKTIQDKQNQQLMETIFNNRMKEEMNH